MNETVHFVSDKIKEYQDVVRKESSFSYDMFAGCIFSRENTLSFSSTRQVFFVP